MDFMKKNIKLRIIYVLISFTVLHCSNNDSLEFQQLKPEPKVKLLHIFDKTPAIRSMFENIEQGEFNRRANAMLDANPEFNAQLYLILGNAMHGTNAPFPGIVRSLATSLDAFHRAYSKDPSSLDTSLDIANKILNLDRSVMTESIDSLIFLAEKLRNWDDKNRDGVIDPDERTFYWDLFSPYQELSDMGYRGLNTLIENLNVGYALFDNAENLSDPATLMKDFYLSVLEENVNVEERMAELIDSIERPEPGEGIRDIEEELADWLAADPIKKGITEFLIRELYPMIKNPVLGGVQVPSDFSSLELPPYLKENGENSIDHYKNFVRRGRWLLDEQMKILAATPKGLSLHAEKKSDDTILLTQWLADSLQKDMQKYDDLENIEIFDFEKNEILHWLGSDDPDDGFYSIGERLKSSLKLTSNPNDAGITKDILRKVAWSGTTYSNIIPGYTLCAPKVKEIECCNVEPPDPDEGGHPHHFKCPPGEEYSIRIFDNGIKCTNIPAQTIYTTTFPGLMYSAAPYPDDPDNPANWTIYPSDGYMTRLAKFKTNDSVEKPFRKQSQNRLPGKTVQTNYQNESIMEAVLTNLQLHILQDYYHCDGEGCKWSLTPEDGEQFFGDSTKNIQTLLGGITWSLQNFLTRDRDGKSRQDGGGELSALSEMLFTMGVSYGAVDPSKAPGELSVQNCMKSMGSPLGYSEYISSTIKGVTAEMHVIGSPYSDMQRKSSLDPNAEFVTYSTQHLMPANELLQPGAFRRRIGSAYAYEWHGKFSPHQGDVIGIADSNGRINTCNWTMSEIALSCWEGYGPYTYRGKAPNGGKRKYENEFYTDWYSIKSARNFDTSIDNYWGPHGPGCGEHNTNYGRYHIFETIYIPQPGEPGFVPSDYNSNTAKYGYIRSHPNGNRHFYNGDYINPWYFVREDNKILVDCQSREEAIRKNLFWLFNQKKYVYIIPAHGWKEIWVVFWIGEIETFAFSVVISNGLAGLANAKRYGPHISQNATWRSGLCTNQLVTMCTQPNYILNVEHSGEPDPYTFRISGVSFNDRDYLVALDYRYYVIDAALFCSPIESAKEVPQIIWSSLGGGPLLPGLIGQNMQVMLTMANKTYSQTDILSPGYSATASTMLKFGKFFTEYYPEVNISELRDNELPPVPRVHGVSYPTAFDASGNAIAWEVWTGESKGMFDDVMALIALIAGTIHEDGTVYKDWSGTPATAADIDNGNITYFGKSGFRSMFDTFVLSTVALNQTQPDHIENVHKREIFCKNCTCRDCECPNPEDQIVVEYDTDVLIKNPYKPLYNKNALVNILVDHDPVTDTVVPGSRKGLLPTLLHSKYANINYLAPLRKGMESAVKSTVRSYLNSFDMTKGPKDNNGDYADLVRYWVDGKRNPEIDWDIPIYRLMYFADNESLAQLERSLSLVRDFSRDTRFIEFLKKAIPVLDDYLYVKWLEENWSPDSPTARPTQEEAKAAGLFQIGLSETDIDDLVGFIRDFDFEGIIQFVKDSRLNDFEGIYNFNLDTWGDEITPGVLKEKIGSINDSLVKNFGINLFESAILGLYEAKVPVKLSDLRSGVAPEKDFVVFDAGDAIYGYGKYLEFDETKDGNGNGIIELTLEQIADGNYLVTGGDDWDGTTPIVFSGDRYYKYIDAKKWIEDNKNNATACKVIFKGLNAYIDFRYDTSKDAFSNYCLSFRTAWYRGGEEHAPNIYNFHNYDLRMDWLMHEYNKQLIVYRSKDFEYGRPLVKYEQPIGKDNVEVYRPATIIDWLFGWDGSSNKGLDIKKELNFLKNAAIDSVYDSTTLEAPDPATNFREKYTASLRQVIQDYRSYIFDKIFEYKYDTSRREKYYSVSSGMDLEDGHRHAINNITELIAELGSPVKRDNPEEGNPNYIVGRLFEAWERFVQIADISQDELPMIQTFAANLLWDESAVRTNTKDPRNLDHLNPGYYTHLLSNIMEKLPPLLKRFQGMYDDLLEMGIITFSEDGIGKYLLDVLRPAERYNSWDLVEEFNYLINTDIFQSEEGDDSFWWHVGHLVEDTAIMLLRREEGHEPYVPFDLYGSFHDMFK